MMHRVDLLHFLRCVEIEYSRLICLSRLYRDTVFRIIVYPELYRDTVFTIIVYLILYHDAVFIGVVFPCSAVARALLCVSCLCWCSKQTCYLPVYSLEIHCRKVSNVEASQWEERVNWKASRATSGAAYFCEVRISGVVDGRNQVLLTRKPGTLVVSTR